MACWRATLIRITKSDIVYSKNGYKVMSVHLFEVIGIVVTVVEILENRM